jgi:hypothetical protein
MKIIMDMDDTSIGISPNVNVKAISYLYQQPWGGYWLLVVAD